MTKKVYPNLSTVDPAENQLNLDVVGDAFTVTNPANKKPTATGDAEKPRYSDIVNVTPGHFYTKDGYERTCDRCHKPYKAYRDTSRFCDNKCRVNFNRYGPQVAK